jgi:hypothetical protein
MQYNTLQTARTNLQSNDVSFQTSSSHLAPRTRPSLQVQLALSCLVPTRRRDVIGIKCVMVCCGVSVCVGVCCCVLCCGVLVCVVVCCVVVCWCVLWCVVLVCVGVCRRVLRSNAVRCVNSGGVIK